MSEGNSLNVISGPCLTWKNTAPPPPQKQIHVLIHNLHDKRYGISMVFLKVPILPWKKKEILLKLDLSICNLISKTS